MFTPSIEIRQAFEDSDERLWIELDTFELFLRKLSIKSFILSTASRHSSKALMMIQTLEKQSTAAWSSFVYSLSIGCVLFRLWPLCKVVNSLCRIAFWRTSWCSRLAIRLTRWNVKHSISDVLTWQSQRTFAEIVTCKCCQSIYSKDLKRFFHPILAGGFHC